MTMGHPLVLVAALLPVSASGVLYAGADHGQGDAEFRSSGLKVLHAELAGALEGVMNFAPSLPLEGGAPSPPLRSFWR